MQREDAPVSDTLRVPPVAPGSRPELADIEARILAERGRISALYQVLLNSPPIAAGWERLLSAVRKQTSLPADLRELVILRVAVLNGARFEFDAHLPLARQAGASEATISALQAASLPPQLPPRERRVLELADAMTRDIVVPGALFAALREHFDDRGLVELVATVAAYNMVSRLLVALQITH